MRRQVMSEAFSRVRIMQRTTHSAADVASELRRRLPDLGVKKLHKLLYLAQGHHLSDGCGPIFTEILSAWDMGPVVASLWKSEKEAESVSSASAELGQAELNTVGYVVSRYGALSGRDLEILTHGQWPWIEANERRVQSGQRSARISTDVLTDYFASAAHSDDDAVTDVLLATTWPPRHLGGASPPAPDNISRLRSRLAELREQLDLPA